MNRAIPLKANENIIFNLRSLYDAYGYSHYKMSKFEEYDLYSKNKDFLVSDGVITFTDTNGRLMALKPDVTLSIIKNTKNSPAEVQKLYYNENVYRVSKSTKSFREIMQVGLECIGNVDCYCICEVLSLAVKSLESISDSFVIDISDLDILMSVLNYAGIDGDERDSVMKLIGEKNFHGLMQKCSQLGIDSEKAELIGRVTSLHGKPDFVENELRKIPGGIVDCDIAQRFFRIISSMENTANVNIDFSVVDNVNYYNGIVFKGFIEGIPNSVLSGGQYDTLMTKMNRKTGAVGFAVYLDMLEQFNVQRSEFDVDTVLLYDGTSDIRDINSALKKLREDSNVLASASVPDGLRYRRLFVMKNGEVTEK